MKNLAAVVISSLFLSVPFGLQAQTAYGNHLIVSAFERQLCPTNAIAPTNGLAAIGGGMGSRLIAETAKTSTGFDSTVYTYNSGRDGDYESNTTIFPIRYDIATTYSSAEGSSARLSSRKLQEFNAADQIISVTGQEWNGLSWVNSDRTLYSYNAAGQNENIISQIYHISTDSWQNVYKISFTYNEHEQVVQAKYDAWNAATSMYEPTELNLYTYEPRALTYVIQLYDAAAGVYQNSSRYIYYFNNGMAQTGELHQTYKGYYWENSDSTIILSNPRTNTAENVFYTWHNGAWGKYGHYIIHYNDDGRQVASQDENLNHLTNQYDGVTKDALSYNTFNQRTNLLTYNLPSGKINSQARYYYETFKIGLGNIATQAGATLDIYPIPAYKSINISMSFPAAQRIDCSIYDLDGKLLQTWKADAGPTYNKEVSITNLPAGTYWLKVNSNESKQMSKSFTVLH